MLRPLPRRTYLLPFLLVFLIHLVARPAVAQESMTPESGTLGPIYLPLVTFSGVEPQAPSAQGVVLAPDATARRVHLPLVANRYQPIHRQIDAIPIAGVPLDRPAAINGDINLALRGYVTTSAQRVLIDIGGPTDVDPPQLASLFNPPRAATIEATWQVHEWNWGCGTNGCRGNPISYPEVTLISLSAGLGEPIHLPTRMAEIYGGGYKALVLYADERRITLTYTRDDSPVYGYMVHLEDVGIDAAIVQRYRELSAAGRNELPALRSGELIGYAFAGSIKVAVRDTGSFMDPRTRKDWWKGY